MMKFPILAVLGFIVLLNACLLNAKEHVSADTFVFPAEFEEHESVWLAWPTRDITERKQDVVLEMIKALTPHVPLDLMVQDLNEMEEVSDILTTQNIPSSKVRLRIIPHDDFWVRDMGPIFLINSKKERIIADFGFNSWGCSPQYGAPVMKDEQVDRLVARELQLPVKRSWLISEGGDREFNGKGVMMATEAVELQRNPGWTKERLEAEFKRVFNVQKIIWLSKGLAEDPLANIGKLPGGKYFSTWTTGGHTDEYARFVKEDTVLLIEFTKEERDEDLIGKINYENMEENFSILKNATDIHGKHFKIIRAPGAYPMTRKLNRDSQVFMELKELEYKDGTVIGIDDTIDVMLPSSYLNFLITNGAVLIPAYWEKGRSEIMRQKDEAFKKIMEEIYPNREIIQINPEDVNLGGGGMHCISQQMPAE